MRHFDKGFTLVELVTTLVIMGVVLGGLPSALDSITVNAAKSEVQTIAAFLAREKMEQIVVRKGVLREFGYNLIGNEALTAFDGDAPFNLYRFAIAAQYKTYTGGGFVDSPVPSDYREVAISVMAPGETVATATLTMIIGNYGE
ncbi:MAG: prepilin-type N-terminal cleavage/methylation domain-containing protein [Pseudomonadota bacterium]